MTGCDIGVCVCVCVCVWLWGVHECLGCYSHDMITRTDGLTAARRSYCWGFGARACVFSVILRQWTWLVVILWEEQRSAKQHLAKLPIPTSEQLAPGHKSEWKLGNSVKSDVHFGHFQGLDFYCQWGHLGFKVCMMCRGTSTIITLIIRVTPCFILEKCVKNTMVLDVRAQNDFVRLSCSCSKLCDVWGLTLKLIPVLIAWSIGLYK